MCEYSEYRIKNGNEAIFCKRTNEICIKQFFCYQVGKRILQKNWKDCYILNKKKIPKNAYDVLFEKKGRLYVMINGIVQKFENKFDTVPEYVFLKETIDGYEISLTEDKHSSSSRGRGRKE